MLCKKKKNLFFSSFFLLLSTRTATCSVTANTPTHTHVTRILCDLHLTLAVELERLWFHTHTHTHTHTHRQGTLSPSLPPPPLLPHSSSLHSFPSPPPVLLCRCPWPPSCAPRAMSLLCSGCSVSLVAEDLVRHTQWEYE